MAAERLSMRTIKEILRLRWGCQPSNREIAQRCGIARSWAADCLAWAAAAGLTWPLSPELNYGTLKAQLYQRPGCPTEPRPLPDWATIQHELRQPGVSLQLLWQECKRPSPRACSAASDLNKFWAAMISAPATWIFQYGC